jgi:hypothetical protein
MLAVALIGLLAWWPAAAAPGAERGVMDSPNDAGVLRTITLDGQPIDRQNAFFKSLGSNGRSCGSCHVPETGWSISPDEVQRRFDKTKGLDPIFRPVDGANSPQAAVDTVAARRAAYNMLLKRAVIRVGLPIPANAEFELVGVDDPYAFASAGELSLFRRPLPATNLRFLTTVMWDGRESYEPMGTTTIRPDVTPEVNALALIDNLLHQADDATMGHAQGAALSAADREDIVKFEMNLATAQRSGRLAGLLSARGAQGGPERVADEAFYVTINDPLGADLSGTPFETHAMRLFDAWKTAGSTHQAAIARGAALFGSAPIAITGVAGLNDDLQMPVITGSCVTCHDSPNIGNHSVALPIDIGVSDASRRTPEMPLYTLQNKATGAIRQSTDPGRALLTGRWNDIGKFKGPVLRGLAARKPYFHDGSAADLRDVVEFYDVRFNIGLTQGEKDDLVAFLSAL